MRRRLSKTDKAALYTINEAFTENIEYIIYSSRYGEAERLLKLISQYQEEKEVSPNIFSGSVHNYPLGFFLLNNKKSIPYNALSACENTVSIGLLSAILTKYNNVLFCYSDYEDEKCSSFAANISKSKEINSIKYRLKLENNDNCNDSFNNFINFFSNNIKEIKTPFYTLESAVK